jgi:hypothetical protein
MSRTQPNQIPTVPEKWKVEECEEMLKTKEGGLGGLFRSNSRNESAGGGTSLRVKVSFRAWVMFYPHTEQTSSVRYTSFRWLADGEARTVLPPRSTRWRDRDGFTLLYIL